MVIITVNLYNLGTLTLNLFMIKPNYAGDLFHRMKVFFVDKSKITN